MGIQGMKNSLIQSLLFLLKILVVGFWGVFNFLKAMKNVKESKEVIERSKVSLGHAKRKKD